MKLQFTSIDINTYSPIIIRQQYNCYDSKIISCFESKSHYIICFYIDDAKKYTIVVFNNELEELKTYPISEISYTHNSIFFKCIHFVEDSGIFFYYESTDSPIIVFKKYISGEIINHFTTIEEIRLYYNYFKLDIAFNNLIKINDAKYILVNTGQDKDSLSVIIINIYEDEKVKIRYYRFASYTLFYYQFASTMRATIYNGLIAIGSGYKLGQSDNTEYSSLIILSYPNSTDFSVDIASNIEENKNAIINLNNSLTIENNLFGYIFYGIKIINYSEGLNLLSQIHQIKINKDYVLIDEEEVELIISKEQNIPEDAKIVFAMVITEPDYKDINNYTYRIDDFCGDDFDEEQNFKKELYVGRNSYCNIIINSESIKNDCNNNCAICLKNNINYCITCKYLYDLSDDKQEKICLDEGILPININKDESDDLSNDIDNKPGKDKETNKYKDTGSNRENNLKKYCSEK